MARYTKALEHARMAHYGVSAKHSPLTLGGFHVAESAKGVRTARQGKRVSKRLGRIKNLTSASHHGRTALTRHGPGGIKAKALKVPKVSRPKVGVKIAHASGVKIPNSMHAMRPTAGLHNHKPHLAAYHARIGHLARNPPKHLGI